MLQDGWQDLRLTERGSKGANQNRSKPLEILANGLTLQRELVRRVRAVEKLKSAQRASLTKLDALFPPLQHRACRGKL